MAEDLITSIIDEAAVNAQLARVDKNLEGLALKLKNFSIPTGGTVTTLKELTAQSKAYAASLTDVANSTKVVLNAEKLAAIERKKIVDERIQQAKLEKAELSLQQTEIKKRAIVEKEAAAQSKAAAAESVAAGRERIIQLKEEQAAAEKLAESEKQRKSNEQQNFSGNYNPGGGKTNIPVNQPLKLTVAQGDIALLKSYESEIAKLTLEQKNALSAFKNGEISQNAYKQTVIQNTEKISALKTNVSQLTKEMSLSAAVNNADRNSLDRARALIAQYTFEKGKLNLATKEGALLNENYNKAIKASNEFILKNADAETIRTKSVGGYTAGIQKAFSGLRTLANILPGIGLSGIFLAGFEAIKFVIEELGILNTKLFDIKAQRKSLAEINEKAAESAGKEVGSLKVLRAEIENSLIPMGKRLQAIKNLREQYPDLLKNTTDEALLQGNAAKAYDLVAAAIIRKARAQSAEARIQELSKQNLDDVFKSQADLDKKNEARAKVKDDVQVASGGSAPGVGGNLGGVSAAAKKQALDRDFIIEKEATQKRIDLRNKEIDFLTKYAAVKENIETHKPGNAAPIVKESTITELNSAFEKEKILRQRRIKDLEADVNDESKTFDERIALLQDFTNESLALNDAQTANDKKALDKKLLAQESNLKKVKGSERNNLITEIANTKTAIDLLEAKNFDERLNIFNTNEKKFTEVEKSALAQEEKLRKDAYERDLKDVESNAGIAKAALDRKYEAESQALAESFVAGQIKKKEFNKQREKLDFDYAVDRIRLELDTAKKILDAQKKAGLDTTKEQEAVAKLAAQLEATILKGKVDAKEKEIISDEELARRKKDLYKQLYAEIASTIQKFLDDGLKREEQNLDEKKRLLDEDTKKKINNINQLGLTEVERVKQISAVEKNAQFQTEQIEKRKRAIAVERAKFEKAAAIAGIVSGTAQAIVSALKVVPGGLVLAGLIGAIGALQLAKAISTPLPKYAKGTDNAIKGNAIYGELGRELVIPKSGSPYLSPGVPTLTSLMGGEKIIPADITATLLNSIGLKGLAGMQPAKAITADNVNSHLMQNMLGELKDLNRKSRIVIKNEADIMTKAYYLKNIRN